MLVLPTGLRRKIRLGPWFRPVFRLLGAMKVLRGTPLDPFGRTRVRRLERELITEYRGKESKPSLLRSWLAALEGREERMRWW